MAEFSVVLVEPKYEGNIGAVARAMKNFGVRRLVLVNPPPIGDEARKRAMHGLDVLEAAVSFETLDEAIKGEDIVIGTSGIDTKNEKKFLRMAVTPRDFAEKVSEMEGKVAMLFGREDYGLLNPELMKCDMLVTIPTDPEYPILNLAQAAVIVLYELYQKPAGSIGREASAMEKDKLHEAFADLLSATNYPPHKVERTKVMFRRMVGRAVPTKWEFHATMGVLTRATKRIKRLESGEGYVKTSKSGRTRPKRLTP
jgi:tRNA/rRNA methyltransferase